MLTYLHVHVSGNVERQSLVCFATNSKGRKKINPEFFDSQVSVEKILYFESNSVQSFLKVLVRRNKDPCTMLSAKHLYLQILKQF